MQYGAVAAICEKSKKLPRREPPTWPLAAEAPLSHVCEWAQVSSGARADPLAASLERPDTPLTPSLRARVSPTRQEVHHTVGCTVRRKSQGLCCMLRQE